MDQRYVDTVRACKVLLRNMDYLEEAITEGQRDEITRLLLKVYDRVVLFLDEEGEDGSDAGEE